MQQNAAQSLLIKDENYDEAILTRERDRLEMLLRNQGYYDFRKQYITFDVDTSYGGNSVRVATVIANPNQGRFHKKYTIRNIYFVEDAGLKRFGVNRDTVVFEGVHYLAYDQYVSPKILDKKVRFGPGQPYSLIRVNRTQRQVTDLDVYRYTAINFNATPDTVNPQLDAFINVTAAKRYQETVEAGINISTFSAAQLSPLPFGSLRLKVRNIFGGAENLEFGVRGGFEGQPSATRDEIVTTTELGTNLALYFPQFLIPFPRYLDPTYGRSRDPLRIYNPRTRLNAAFTYTDREDYTRTNTELSLAYFWQRSQQLQWVVSIADINIVNVPFLSARFRTQLQGWASNGQPLIESFRSAVLSGVNATRLYNSNDLNQTRDAKFLKLYAEIGNVPRVLSLGKLPGFSNLFTEFTANSDGTDRYRAFSFAKVNADGRRYIKIREKMFVVGRANLGLATPVPGGRNNILPYEKFYFAGGGSSIRAWRPRKLGPGSYSPPFLEEDGEIVTVNGFPQRDDSYEQPGEILKEFNTEYRFNIFSIW
ncbi:MAG TPA: BamA/TamA family outer membrane protein, partial [Adhaeribacter sp.]|nr:BamA/TamA family outer membrane protein [Adhaeribacter sp.]